MLYVKDSSNKYVPATEDYIINYASAVAHNKLQLQIDKINSPDQAIAYIKAALRSYKSEVFSVLFLDNKHKVLKFDILFYGTINESAVYPREVVKAALEYNAAAMILAHNHPSGDCEPSESDKRITKVLQDTMKYIDVRILDHIIVGHDAYSFANNNDL